MYMYALDLYHTYVYEIITVKKSILCPNFDYKLVDKNLQQEGHVATLNTVIESIFHQIR